MAAVFGVGLREHIQFDVVRLAVLLHERILQVVNLVICQRQTQAQVKQLIYDYLYDEATGLPVDAYSDDEVKELAEVVYLHVYQQYETADHNVYVQQGVGS